MKNLGRCAYKNCWWRCWEGVNWTGSYTCGFFQIFLSGKRSWIPLFSISLLWDGGSTAALKDSKIQMQCGRLHSYYFVTFTLIHNEWNREYPHNCISHSEYSWGDVFNCRWWRQRQAKDFTLKSGIFDIFPPWILLNPPSHHHTHTLPFFNYILPIQWWLENTTICSVEHTESFSSETT